MGVSFNFSMENGSLSSYSNNAKNKRDKGKSLLFFPHDYVVIDLETTGLSPVYDEIIELSALKVINGNIEDKFSTLVKPENRYIDDSGNELYVDEFITELTGITNEMLDDAPSFADIYGKFLNFVDDNIIVGHNVNFDINFIYDSLVRISEVKFKNNFCDLLRISRKIFPEFPNHKLSTVASELHVFVSEAHRGLADCITTFKCFQKCFEYVKKNNISLDFYARTNIDLKKTTPAIDLKKITPAKENFDTSHPLFGQTCVFTGTLENMKRVEAAQLVVNLGGICENGVTTRTNFLILGNNDYCKSIKNGKSNKQKKAEKLILGGQDLKILPEDAFYDMLRFCSLDEARNIIIQNENAQAAAFVLEEKSLWYFVLCDKNEVEKIESNIEGNINSESIVFCFNQFTGNYNKLEI